MKFSLLVFLLSSLSFAQPEIILAPVDHLYIPEGFDSNDSVEVIVTGTFSNACFSRNNVEVKVRDQLIDIRITAMAPEVIMMAGRMCPQMIVPFKEVVSLGNLQGGDYKVVVNAGSSFTLKNTLKVAEASSNSVDDHIYAAVEWVERKSENEFILHGWRYSNCIDLDKVKVVSNGLDTLSVLPVMKQLSDFCPMKMTPTAYPVKLDFSSIKMKRPLLHVRTMDGKSVNSIVPIKENL
jgi:hypothetical protein